MRKVFKKATALLLVTSMAAGLAACSSGGNGGSTTAATTETQTGESKTEQNESASETDQTESVKTDPNEKVTIRFSWWGADTRHEATLKVMDMYMKKHPNVTIEGEYGAFDSFYQKLQTLSLIHI